MLKNEMFALETFGASAPYIGPRPNKINCSIVLYYSEIRVHVYCYNTCKRCLSSNASTIILLAYYILCSIHDNV